MDNKSLLHTRWNVALQFLLTILLKSILTMCKGVLYSSFRYAEKYHYIANDFSKADVKRAVSVKKRELLKQQKNHPDMVGLSGSTGKKLKNQQKIIGNNS